MLLPTLSVDGLDTVIDTIHAEFIAPQTNDLTVDFMGCKGDGIVAAAETLE